MEEKTEFERLDRKLIHRGAIIDLYQDSVRTPSGHVAKWDFIGHKGAAAVVPVTERGTILMVRQYRNAIDRYTLEIPAGGRDSLEEKTYDCAARELEEETGFRSDHLELLIQLKTAVAYCNEFIDVYVAKIWYHPISIWMRTSSSTCASTRWMRCVRKSSPVRSRMPRPLRPLWRIK